MHIRVIGSNMDVVGALTKYAEEHIEKHVTKYFDTAINADVHFTKQKDTIHVNILVNEGVKGGIKVKSDAEGSDAYAVFNEAMDKASRQLRRYKRKIKNYRRKEGGLKSVDISDIIFDSPKYVISPFSFATNPALEEMEEDALREIQEEEKLNIVAEKTTEIEELTVEQAIMKMDLEGLPALVFVNVANKRINVVYHRKDGNISWIDPQIQK